MNETKIISLQGHERKQQKQENIETLFNEAVEFVRKTVKERMTEQERIRYSNSIENLIA